MCGSKKNADVCVWTQEIALKTLSGIMKRASASALNVRNAMQVNTWTLMTANVSARPNQRRARDLVTRFPRPGIANPASVSVRPKIALL
jgi:hypothetical protein